MAAGPPIQQRRSCSQTLSMESYGIMGVVETSGKWWERFHVVLGSRKRRVLFGILLVVASAFTNAMLLLLSFLLTVVVVAAPVYTSPSPLNLEVEAFTAEAVGMGGCVSVDGQPLGPDAPGTLGTRCRSVREWVVKTKLKFGEVGNKPADIICVKRWLAEEMAKLPDLRDSDKRRLIPVVAMLSSVPDEADVFAAAVEKTAVVRAMRAMAGSKAT